MKDLTTLINEALSRFIVFEIKMDEAEKIFKNPNAFAFCTWGEQIGTNCMFSDKHGLKIQQFDDFGVIQRTKVVNWEWPDIPKCNYEIVKQIVKATCQVYGPFNDLTYKFYAELFEKYSNLPKSFIRKELKEIVSLVDDSNCMDMKF